MSEERNATNFVCRCLQSVDCAMHQLTSEKRLGIMNDLMEKIKGIMHGDEDYKISFTAEEYTHYLLCACSLSLGERPEKSASKLFHMFFSALETAITTVVLPALEGKEFEELLRELLAMWNKYKQMAHWLVRFCHPLRIHPYLANGVPIGNVPKNVICDMVFDVIWDKLQETITLMIKQERDEKLIIDQDLLRRTVEFCIEIQHIGKRPYYETLEEAILEETSRYYSELASELLSHSTFGGYIQKVGQWYEREEAQKKCYLNEALLVNVLKVAKAELLDQHINEVAELIPSSGLGLLRLLPKPEVSDVKEKILV